MSLLGLNIYGGQGLAPYGLRWEDDTSGGQPFSPKGLGYFGMIPTDSGMPMTELSTTFDVDGKMVSAPLVVPTLTQEEVGLLASGQDVPESIYQKAYDFAVQRIAENKDPFANPEELRLKGLLGL